MAKGMAATAAKRPMAKGLTLAVMKNKADLRHHSRLAT
jgi:hypothetical protein